MKIELNRERAEKFISNVYDKECCFILTISYTETCEIPGITVAGADPELLKYTPAADAEFLYYGRCRCIDSLPATPDGKPTPALITRAALRSANIPVLVVDAGSKIKPDLPYISMASEHGKSIESGRAMDLKYVEDLFEKGKEFGSMISRICKFIVLGESIPAGTTTALGVLLAMGIDARFKVSSSMPENPHVLKIDTVMKGMKEASIDIGDLAKKPLHAISSLGDPMMAAVAGMAIGASNNAYVMLAGGTQMAAISMIIRSIDPSSLSKIAIGTTKYIIEDRSSNVIDLISNVSKELPLISVDPLLHQSSKMGLRSYANGFVKEGVGAGGACISAMLKKVRAESLLKAIEEEYSRSIEKKLDT